MNRVPTLLICLILASIVPIPLHSQSYTTEQRSKAIHIVYDDSVTMIRDDDGVYVDRWAQAKYAMEVFAVMLEEKDTMRVYYMSDFDVLNKGNLDASARINILGSEPTANRVAKVHNTVTESHNTPYDTVVKAYADLKNTNADKKWLVVMTDGEYNFLNGQANENVPVNNYFSQYINESAVNICILAMGTQFKTVFKEVPNRIFFDQAKDNNEILGKIISICNRIFNRNKIDFTNVTRREFSFDIPMEELLVFAQGAEVKVNSMKGSVTYKPSEAINVRYSEKAATSENFANNPNVVIPRNLTGVIATFPNVKKGSYSLDIDGARTVDVYYKPEVKVDIKLLRNRREVRANDITEGKYHIQYGIVDEKGKFFESTLLGNVEYTATIQNNGRTTPIEFDEAVNLKQGELEVYVLARFLEFNTADNRLTRKVSVPLSLKERFLNWIKLYWFIFWPLVFLLLALLLFWIIWGRKKRFPKYMRKSKPGIMIETDENTIIKSGSFRITPRTKWLPFCAETGTIVAVADGKPLPSLKVKATGDEYMELTNTGDFSSDKLSGIEFYINDQPLPEGATQNKKMSCTAQIKSIYYGAGSATTYTCSFARRGKGHKKGRKR